MSPKISVIVPVYKVEQYLPRCVDSILSQSFSDFELILVDDGSPDNSGKICDEYAVKDNRVRVFHKPNGGVSSARNWGLDNIQGEWVYFVDADDILFEDCLETLLIKDSEKYDCVIGGYINTNGERITSNIVPIVDVVWDYKKALLDFYTPIYFPFNGYLWNRLFRSSVIKQNNLRFRKDIFYKEDGLFVIEFICKSKKDVYVTTKPVYQYYINPNGAMQSLRVHFEPKYLTNMDARILCWENVREVTSWHDFKLRFRAKHCIVQFYYCVEYYIRLHNVADKSIIQDLTFKMKQNITVPYIYRIYDFLQDFKMKVKSRISCIIKK